MLSSWSSFDPRLHDNKLFEINSASIWQVVWSSMCPELILFKGIDQCEKSPDISLVVTSRFSVYLIALLWFARYHSRLNLSKWIGDRRWCNEWGRLDIESLMSLMKLMQSITKMIRVSKWTWHIQRLRDSGNLPHSPQLNFCTHADKGVKLCWRIRAWQSTKSA